MAEKYAGVVVFNITDKNLLGCGAGVGCKPGVAVECPNGLGIFVLPK